MAPDPQIRTSFFKDKKLQRSHKIVEISVADPDPQDPHVLGLPDPDLLVRGTDPDPDPAPIPDPSIIKQKQN